MSDPHNGNGQNGTKARWAGVLVTIILAAGAMTIQWGVVTTKLQQLEKRMDEFIGEARSIPDAPDAAWIGIAHEPVVSGESLEQHRVFTSVLSVTYRVRR